MARLLLYKMAGRRNEGHTKNLMIAYIINAEFKIKVSVYIFAVHVETNETGFC